MLTHQVPMVVIMDLLEAIQRPVVGVLQYWMQLLWWVDNATIFCQDSDLGLDP